MAKKHLSPLEISHFQRPSHITLCLTETMTSDQFISQITEALNLTEPHNFSFGIIGLHPCGDLGAILMRMYLQCPQAKFLNFVGCCYMKLSSRSEKSNCGYPLSNYLLQQTPAKLAHLSYEAKEISCHAMEMYSDRLAMRDYEHLKIHSYRAAAERVLVKHLPELRHCGLRGVQVGKEMPFEE